MEISSRAVNCGVSERSAAKLRWIEFYRGGWRKNEPGYVRPDRAIRFEDMLDGEVQNGEISWREAESVTAISEPELQARLKLAMGISQEEPEEEDSNEPHVLKMRL